MSDSLCTSMTTTSVCISIQQLAAPAKFLQENSTKRFCSASQMYRFATSRVWYPAPRKQTKHKIESGGHIFLAIVAVFRFEWKAKFIDTFLVKAKERELRIPGSLPPIFPLVGALHYQSPKMLLRSIRLWHHLGLHEPARSFSLTK